MYWEDVYKFYEIASNMDVLDSNEEMKFNYLLHAQTEDALKKWKDLTIPFPARDWNPLKASEKKPAVFERATKRVKTTDPAVIARFKEIQRRVMENEENY